MTDRMHPYGRWQPWSPQDVAAFFASLAVPWWIAGGWAIDLFLERQTRAHEDVDVLVLREHQHEVRALFADWDMQAAAPGSAEWPFYAWETGHTLRPETHDIWCRPSKTAPWALQFMIADTRDGQWVFRRYPELTRPLATIGRTTSDGIPYLSPDIQLLHKARGLRPKDEEDFLQTLPYLDRASRQWLQQALAIVHPDHPWLVQLGDS